MNKRMQPHDCYFCNLKRQIPVAYRTRIFQFLRSLFAGVGKWEYETLTFFSTVLSLFL